MFFSHGQTLLSANEASNCDIDVDAASQLREIQFSLRPDIFVRNSTADRGQVKRRLLHDLKWPYVCRQCNNGMFEHRAGVPFWFGKPVTLQLEHRNGNSSDNRLENLELLCPICHSQTDTYAGRNSLAARAKRARRLAESHEQSRPISSPSRFSFEAL
jgi:hypothetical protein